MREHDEVLELIRQEKLIAILRGVPFSDIPGVVEALISGGVKVLEFTFDHACPDDRIKNAEKIRYTVSHYGDQVAVGCGTAISTEDLDAAAEAGACLAVTPNTDTELILYAKKKGLVIIPGAMTPTEAVSAWKSGADIVKLFPGGEMGLAYIKALQGPLSFIPMCAVGGIQPENVKEFLGAGMCGIGVGSALVPKDALAKKDYGVILRRAQQFVKAIRDAEKA